MKKYRFSFTGANFMFNESVKIAEIYQELENWDDVQNIVVEENLLQKNKKNTIKREFRELKLRLTNLTAEQLYYIPEATSDEQKYLIFLAICKTYRFISDFVIQVVRNKYLNLDIKLHNSDYERFVLYIEDEHEEFESLSDSSKAKIRNLTINFLCNSGIVMDKVNMIINKPYLTSELKELIISDNPKYLGLFLESDSDIKNYINQE